jgi:hypothetical protein
MTVVATDTRRYSNLVKREMWAEWGYCKKLVTVYQGAATLAIGAVLGKFIASPTGTASAAAGNTGNGAMGAVTVTSNKNLQLGTYKVTIVKAAANAGDFVVTDPAGDVAGFGTVAVAYSQGGIAFTLADGATDFVVGDSFNIVVAGTEKYKLVEATATDGTEVASVVVVGNATGNAVSTAVTANTDTSFLVLYRGPCAVADTALSYGTSVNTDDEKTALYNQLRAVGIDVLTQI